MLRRASRLLLLAAPLLSLVGAGLVHADAITVGLTVTVYDNSTPWNEYNNAPPLPPTTPVAGITTASRIEDYFDQTPLFGLQEDFVVKYEGFITAPCTCSVQFLAEGDDGTILYLDEQIVTYDWWDKGGGGTVSDPVLFDANTPKSLTLWFYENGGGAWVRLWWLVDNEWQIVPSTAFIGGSATTTTTSTTTTTTPTTTTQEPTTTTTVAETLPPTTSSTTTVPQTTTSFVPPSTTVAPTTTYATTTVAPETTTTTTTPTTTTIAPEPAAVVTALLEKPLEQVTVDDLGDVLDPEVAKDLEPEQIDELVTVIADKVDDLSDQELLVLAESLSNAPVEVKDAFEAEVNVFDGKFDTYVPTGSKVSVGERRVLNAVVATIVAAPAVVASGTTTQRKNR